MHPAREEYLRKAREAEANAQTAADIASKNKWLKIAAGYYELASPKPLG